MKVRRSLTLGRYCWGRSYKINSVNLGYPGFESSDWLIKFTAANQSAKNERSVNLNFKILFRIGPCLQFDLIRIFKIYMTCVPIEPSVGLQLELTGFFPTHLGGLGLLKMSHLQV